jgi:protoheme ferro-lyase
MTRQHVILVTYGEPPAADFFAQLRYSWRILLGLTRSVAPIPLPLLPLIAVRRALLRWRTWTAERYRSPLEPITRHQAEGLAAALHEAAPGVDWRLHVAYEFRNPRLPAVLSAIPPDQPATVVPLYVAESAFTHEITRATVAEWCRSSPRRTAPVGVLPAMDEATLAELSVRHVRRQVAEAGWEAGPDCALVLAAHGTLLSPPRPMETGREATERIGRRIAGGLAGEYGAIFLGWLNHVYGGRWTEPSVEEALGQAVQGGFRRAVYYPYGFLADNAESELEGRVALRARPDLRAIHLPCLNGSAEALAALARQVREQVSSEGRHSRQGGIRSGEAASGAMRPKRPG